MTLPTPDTNSDASGEISLPPGLFVDKGAERATGSESRDGEGAAGTQANRSKMRSAGRQSRSSRSSVSETESDSRSPSGSAAPKRMRRRSKDDGEFDPTRHTGERSVRSFLGDVGYFASQQVEELKNVLRRARRLSRDMLDEVLSKLRR